MTDRITDHLMQFRTWFVTLGRRQVIMLLTAFSLGIASIAGVVAQSSGPSGPAGSSPASGNAAVIAQGVVTMPAADLRWNVTARTADVSQGPIVLDATGFILATRSPILVIDESTMSKTRLAAGEAMFVREGQSLAFETFGAPDQYAFMALQPADAIPAEGTSIYQSSVFTGDGTERDTDLIRDILAAGEQSLLPVGAVPTLVYVTRGEVTITTPDGDTTLSVGTASVFPSAITVTGGNEGASYAAAYVGTTLGDTASPVASPDVASPALTVVPASPEPTTEPTSEPTEEPTEEPTTEATETPDPELDTDEDGIPDVNEIAIGTDPFNLDSDDDILYDGGELFYGSNPLNPDSDEDGLSDGEEIYFSETDPTEADTDGDGISDGNEINNGTDPLDSTNGEADIDEDLVIDPQPEPDTDPDPVAPPSNGNVDSDGDGLTDEQEEFFGTNPGEGDSDGDTVNDSNEIAAGTNPNDSTDFP